MYYTVIGLVLGVLGVLQVGFAFVQPPQALQALVGWSGGRKMRALMSFVPEAQRERATRLVVGILMLVASAAALRVGFGI